MRILQVNSSDLGGEADLGRGQLYRMIRPSGGQNRERTDQEMKGSSDAKCERKLTLP